MSAEQQPPKPPDNKPIEDVEEGIEEAVETELAEIPPDSLAADENQSLEKGGSLAETKQIQNLSEQHDVHATRLGYVPKLFWLIVGWLAVTTTLLVLSGINWHYFRLSDKVLIALITSTTANVLGLFYVVAKWLYPAPISKKQETKKDE